MATLRAARRFSRLLPALLLSFLVAHPSLAHGSASRVDASGPPASAHGAPAELGLAGLDLSFGRTSGYPETRIGAFGISGADRIGVELSVNHEAPWGCETEGNEKASDEHLSAWVHNARLIRARTWNQFQKRTRGWFTKSNSWFQRVGKALENPKLEAAQAWHWYRSAKHGTETLVLGEITAARAFAKNNAGFSRLWGSPWNLGVNDAWIAGGIERGARFRVVSDIFDPALRTTALRGGRTVESVFAREVRMLQEAGYRFEQGVGMAAGHGWLVR